MLDEVSVLCHMVGDIFLSEGRVILWVKASHMIEIWVLASQIKVMSVPSFT